MHQSVPPVSDEAKRLAGIAASWFLGQQLSAITGVIPTGDDPALIEAFAYAGRKLEGSPASEDLVRRPSWQRSLRTTCPV